MNPADIEISRVKEHGLLHFLPSGRLLGEMQQTLTRSCIAQEQMHGAALNNCRPIKHTSDNQASKQNHTLDTHLLQHNMATTELLLRDFRGSI